jgi:phosphate starvation-inducible PhoH-like protein
MGKPTPTTTHTPDPIQPQTPNQDKLMKAIRTNDQVVVLGAAGTGKTFIMAGMAADWYVKRNKNRIIITRPMIPVGEELGHLPGTLEEKVTPWAKPVLNIIRSRIGAGKLECDLHKNIEIIPLQLMRGETFDDAWILVDEAQNITVEQAKMLVTRVGVNAKLLINGDLAQKDISEASGLAWLINTIKRRNMRIPVVEFGIEDCQRSGICREWLEAIADEQSNQIVWETVARK